MVLSCIEPIKVNGRTGRKLDKRSVSEKMLTETVLPIKLVGVLVFLFHLCTGQVISDCDFYVRVHVLKTTDTIPNHNQQKNQNSTA